MLPVPAIVAQVKNVEQDWEHDEDASQHHEQGERYHMQQHLQAHAIFPKLELIAPSSTAKAHAEAASSNI